MGYSQQIPECTRLNYVIQCLNKPMLSSRSYSRSSWGRKWPTLVCARVSCLWLAVGSGVVVPSARRGTVYGDSSSLGTAFWASDVCWMDLGTRIAANADGGIELGVGLASEKIA